MTLLTTPIFYFHGVISALRTLLTTLTPIPTLSLVKARRKRSLRVLLSFAAHSRVLLRLASLAINGELASRLPLRRTKR